MPRNGRPLAALAALLLPVSLAAVGLLATPAVLAAAQRVEPAPSVAACPPGQAPAER